MYPVPVPSANLEQSLGEAKIFDYHGVKINYYEGGQGPPIILLHGFGGCAYSWRFLAPARGTCFTGCRIICLLFSVDS